VTKAAREVWNSRECLHSWMRKTDRSHLRSKGHEIDRRSMSDRFGTDGAKSHQAAKLDKQFYMCGFEGIGERRTPVGRDADGSFFQLLDLGS